MPMIVINGRMSQRSFQRWRRISANDRGAARPIRDVPRAVAWRCRPVRGARQPHVFNTGNLKFDVRAPPADNAKLERLMAVTRGRPVIVAASTHPGEEEIVLDVHRRLAAYFPRC